MIKVNVFYCTVLFSRQAALEKKFPLFTLLLAFSWWKQAITGDLPSSYSAVVGLNVLLV